MNNYLNSKIYFPQCLFFPKIICLEKSYICWLDAVRLGSSCETGNTDRNGVNNQNTPPPPPPHTHTHTNHSEKDNTGKG